jgi:hypothetical protein
MRNKTFLLVCVSAGLLHGCSGKSDQHVEDADDDAATETLEPDDSAGPDEPDEPDDPDDGTGGDSGPSSVGFIDEDTPPDILDCNVWTQDCLEGEKCMPWDSFGGSSWNATRCTPLAPNPGQPGDECTVEGGGVSGVDDCDMASMCWQVDPETNIGTCVPFCNGTELSPSCDDPGTTCSIFNAGVLILCLPKCDPLGQDCSDGQGCYASSDGFVCIPDASGPDGGSYGDPCEYVNVCNPGLFCAAAAAVPGCQGSQGCCSEFCDLSSPDAAAVCSGVGGGQECVAWYEDGQVPPGYDDVGACAIPG